MSDIVDAAERLLNALDENDQDGLTAFGEEYGGLRAAVNAARRADRQPKAEGAKPAAWRWRLNSSDEWALCETFGAAEFAAIHGATVEPLYLAPPSPEQGVDWQFAALRETVARLPPSPDDSAFGPLSGTHLQDMLSRVEGDPSSFSRAKLGRWLGWAQCAVVARARGTLDDMKEINRQHSRASPRKDAGTAAPAKPDGLRAEIKRVLDDLNVNDKELIRIGNTCVGTYGDVKIWSKMLATLVRFAREARPLLQAALSATAKEKK